MELEEIKKRAEVLKKETPINGTHDVAAMTVDDFVWAADTILQLCAEVEKLRLITDELPCNDNWSTEYDMQFSQERYDAAERLYNSREYGTKFTELSFDEVLYLRCIAKDLHIQPNIVNISNRLQLLQCLIIHIENRNTWYKEASKLTAANKILRDGLEFYESEKHDDSQTSIDREPHVVEYQGGKLHLTKSGKTARKAIAEADEVLK